MSPRAPADGSATRAPLSQTSLFHIVAQDPSIKQGRRALTAEVEVPAEHLEPGPRGARFHVVDYESATGRLQTPTRLRPGTDVVAEAAHTRELTGSPAVRAQNVYVIAARTLASFEGALGRRLAWRFNGHQLYLIPHAFPEANAYYAPEDGAIYFGYVPGADGGEALAALSHDVVAHETTHAVLDGLKPLYAEPGLPDQAAFHEALGDIAALLSVFSLPEVVGRLLDASPGGRDLPAAKLTADALGQTALFTLAEELGASVSGGRGSALRRSVELPVSAEWRTDPAYDEPHRRGEIVVAAVMRTVLRIWAERLVALTKSGKADRDRVCEEGAKSAAHMLRMVIRGLDYMPPVELEFEDVLDAILKADEVLAPDDEHGYRPALAEIFGAFGVTRPVGRIVDLASGRAPRYERVNFNSLRSDRDEVFRFIWDNASIFKINRTYRMRVESVRPSIRVGPDGLIVGEVVAEYSQTLELTAGELPEQVQAPDALEASTELQILGGGVIVFDQFGRAKFQQAKPLDDWARQQRRLDYLVARGLTDGDGRFGFTYSLPRGQRFALLHLPDDRAGEDW